MNALTQEQLRAEAVLRVRRALAKVETAQNALNEACAELSALEGGIPVWTACHKLADKVHAFWYRVDRFRSGGKFKLDGTNVEALERRLAAEAARQLPARSDLERESGRRGGE